jgi:hypothetical protein
MRRRLRRRKSACHGCSCILHPPRGAAGDLLGFREAVFLASAASLPQPVVSMLVASGAVIMR